MAVVTTAPAARIVINSIVFVVVVLVTYRENNVEFVWIARSNQSLFALLEIAVSRKVAALNWKLFVSHVVGFFLKK